MPPSFTRPDQLELPLTSSISEAWATRNAQSNPPGHLGGVRTYRQHGDARSCARRSVLAMMRLPLFLLAVATLASGLVYTNDEAGNGVHLPIRRAIRTLQKRDGDVADTGLGDVFDV